jgi:hypothetical protein
MVQYPFGVLKAVSEVEPLTTNAISDIYGRFHPFALRYRRVNGTFYERIKTPVAKSPSLLYGEV